ncbi:MAG: hypothetical protein DRR16_22780 [Candidatus Parabeggiatoa sp. nov. 3]|nr:MAG: hypothetical protein DRR00_28975 [Gammaproteobacteria bacterium]RKZ68493.1 MAG: hypothetical protein DRQ99_03735 [Gammaproteobacteria bacterium]RKZ81034.1 MAG: hypothetical protein DRR16_22780 [Gammaproteobacteria bacterium]
MFIFNDLTKLIGAKRGPLTTYQFVKNDEMMKNQKVLVVGMIGYLGKFLVEEFKRLCCSNR